MTTLDAVGLLDHDVWESNILVGDYVSAQGGTHDVIEPATGEVLTRVGIANASDVALATKTAAAAQTAWAATPPRERAGVFHRAAALFQQHFDELALYVTRETGGILPKGQHEVREAVAICQLAAAMPMQPQGQVLPSTPGRLSLARRVPRGVVGVISPFNFPLILTIRAVAPALAAGNAVVIKPDPRTPVTGGFIIARAVRGGRPAQGRCCRCCPAAPRPARRWCTDPRHRR